MNIRRMNDDDIDEVCRIENESFSVPWSRESIVKAYQNNDNIYLVVEDEGHIIGFAGFWTSYETADLCNIVVDKAYRKKHAGYKMLDEGIQICRENNIERIMLEVRRSNLSAINLYKKMGFCDIGVRKAYYSEPVEDALIMEKIL